MVKEKSKVVRSRLAVTVDGVEYVSRTACAKALVAAGKSLSEAASLSGMTYQTVYSVTKGAEKVAGRRANYRIVDLGKSGKRSAGEIAKKVGVSTSKVVAILKKAGVAVVSKEAVEKNKPAEKSEPVVKKSVKKNKKVKLKVDEVPLTLQQVIAEEIVDLSTEDDLAMQAAMADMSH